MESTMILCVNRDTNQATLYLLKRGPTASPFPFIPENLQSKNCAVLSMFNSRALFSKVVGQNSQFVCIIKSYTAGKYNIFSYQNQYFRNE